MFLDDVEKRYQMGRADNRGYLIVCQDVWDYRRGDSDLGYYYVFWDTAEEVQDQLKNMPFAPEGGTGIKDRCHAVIDLKSGTETFSEELCTHPSDWLRSQIRSL